MIGEEWRQSGDESSDMKITNLKILTLKILKHENNTTKYSKPFLSGFKIKNQNCRAWKRRTQEISNENITNLRDQFEVAHLKPMLALKGRSFTTWSPRMGGQKNLS